MIDWSIDWLIDWNREELPDPPGYAPIPLTNHPGKDTASKIHYDIDADTFCRQMDPDPTPQYLELLKSFFLWSLYDESWRDCTQVILYENITMPDLQCYPWKLQILEIIWEILAFLGLKV